MNALSRIAAALLAAYGTLRATGAQPYMLRIALCFAAAAFAAAMVREVWSTSAHPVRTVIGDIVTGTILAGLMILGVRAFGHGHAPTPLFPALAWPLVDLWRPQRKRVTR